MPRSFTFTRRREFHLLAFSMAVAVFASAYVDWIIVNSVLVPSGRADWERTLYPSYYVAWEASKWAVILPLLAVVWILKRRVKSIVVWAVSLYAPLVTGSEDLAYYLIGMQPVPETLPWLNNAPWIAWVNQVLHTDVVTQTGLLLSTTVAYVVLILLWKAYFD